MSTLLVGGFGLPAGVLRPLARDLQGTIVPTGLTIGCGEAEATKVVAAIDAAPEAVVLVGHSRGGQLARVAAARRPEHVRRLITVGTPATIGPPQRWGVPLVTAALRRLPQPIALDCATGDCCAAFRADLARPVAIPWVAVWSPHDRVVPPHEATADGADSVEVHTGHIGLVLAPEGRRAIVAAATR